MNSLYCRHFILLASVGLLCHCETSLSPPLNPVKRGIRSEDQSRVFERAYQIGQKDAERDIKKGVLAIEVYGMPPPPGRGMPMHPGVEERSVAGCVVDDQILGHAKGYNKVSQAAIQQRFGSLYPRRPNQKK